MLRLLDGCQYDLKHNDQTYTVETSNQLPETVIGQTLAATDVSKLQSSRLWTYTKSVGTL